MKKIYFVKIIVGLMLGAMVLPVRAVLPGLVTLPGHVPSVVSRLQPIGQLSTTTNLHLAIGLPLHNCEALTNLLQQIYDPSSPNYHHYLTPEQFTEQFGPTPQDYQKVMDFATANGLTVTGTYSNRMLVDVSGTVTNIEQAFHVTLEVYHHPTENRNFFAPDTNPSVPVDLPIQDISGLNNYSQPHPNYVVEKTNSLSKVTPNAATPNLGSRPDGSYIGDDFRNAYVPGSSLNGSGQTVALVQFDGYYASDINTYETLAGRTNIPLQNVLIDGFTGVPTGNGGEVEVSLDIEMLVSMAPALAKIIVYEGNPYNVIPNDVLNRIASDNSARQISCSWGWNEGPNAKTDQIFQEMALQGQTFFTASGDSDAYPSGSIDDPSLDGTPSDNPYLTSVGGTTLTMDGTGASFASETVWNWGITEGRDGIGSSGGYSSYYSIPSWQTNINMTARGGLPTARNFPDVALTADNVFVVSDGGQQNIVGGTSCAAPLWAGFTALINQQATNNGYASVGFLNPALYALAAGTNYANCFHDVTTGNNTWSGSPNLFFAAFNYDLCTGLGTPNGTNLINALTAVVNTNAIPYISAPPPPYGPTLSTLNGSNPNGPWYLFVQDDKALDAGMIANGWILNLFIGNPVGQAADLETSMASTAANVPLGSNVVYIVGVTNYGPSFISTNVVVSDTLPVGSTVISAIVTQGSVVHSGSSLIWNVDTLGTNSTPVGARLTLTLQPSAAGSMLNYAIASADTFDPNPDDDAASATVTVGTIGAPQISGSLVNGTGGFQLTITTSNAPASTIIQASTNLINWVNIYTSTPPFTFTDPNATNYSSRFYRAVLGP